MEYSYKFRLYPTKEQEQQMVKNFGCARFVFNYLLELRKKVYEAEKRTLGCYDCNILLPGLKESYPWLREVDSTSLQAASQNLDDAFKNFFRRCKEGENPGYPRFKSKHDRRQSYKSKRVGGNIKVFPNAVQLPKLGKVKCRISKEVKGRILSATVSRNPSEKYFISLCCTDVEIAPLPTTGAVVGVDLGIKALAVTSDGVVFPNPKRLAKSQKRLVRLQQRLSRKSKGSHNREKARVAVAKAHEKIANQRNDALHKLTTDLVRRYDVICIEDLAPSNMVRNHKLASSISDASWGELRRQLEYKAKWYGKTVSTVDRFYPSSQLCSFCGVPYPGTKDLSVRSWKCPSCGAIHDRDTNAAVNILHKGLRLLA